MRDNDELVFFLGCRHQTHFDKARVALNKAPCSRIEAWPHTLKLLPHSKTPPMINVEEEVLRNAQEMAFRLRNKDQSKNYNHDCPIISGLEKCLFSAWTGALGLGLRAAGALKFCISCRKSQEHYRKIIDLGPGWGPGLIPGPRPRAQICDSSTEKSQKESTNTERSQKKCNRCQNLQIHINKNMHLQSTLKSQLNHRKKS